MPPQPPVEAAELLLYRQEGPGVFAHRIDFEPVADDRRFLSQGFQFFILHRGTAADIKSVERPAIAFALAQHRFPAEASLSAFQDQIFEQKPVVMNRDTPFPVMIFAIKFLARLSAKAALLAVASRHCHGTGLAAPGEFDNFIQQAVRRVPAHRPAPTSRSAACRR